MIRKLLVSIIPLAAITFLTSLQMSDNGKAGKTGSPGELNCTDCHNSFTVNSGGGSISLQSTGTPGFQYSPGQTYTMSVTVSRTGSSLFGVGIEALTSTNANGGTLNITDAASTQIKNATVSAVSRRNIVHQLNGGASANSKVFNFSWTAPVAGTGNVTFYFAGVAAIGSGNGNEDNDYVYVSSQVFTELTCAGPPQPSAISGVSSICNGASTSYSIPAVAGATSYIWSLPSGWSGTSTTTSITANAGLSGTISVVANNGCGLSPASTMSVSTVTIAATPAITNVACFGGSNGSVNVTPSGGTPSYTYLWSPSGGSSSSASNLIAGNYSVRITDANGCSSSIPAVVTQPAVITAVTTPTNPVCFGATNGSATVVAGGGSPGYSYNWLPSGGTAATANNLSAGTYTVTVTDAKSCTKTSSVTITQPTIIASVVTPVNATCFGSSNGSATAVVSGGTPGYQYSWTPGGATTASATNLIAGTYTVIVTDLLGCTKTSTTTISQPSQITLSVNTTDASCGAATGTATANPTGGTGAYTYTWTTTPSQTTQVATNLGAGNYIVTVTDANGCTSTSGATINQPSTLSASSSVADVSCNGGSNGSATVNVSGGSPAYTYSWNTTPTQDSSTATNLIAGSYTALITDLSGCSYSIAVTITEPSPLVSSAGIDQIICEGSGITIGGSPTATGGSSPFSYSWNPTANLSSTTDSNPLASPFSNTIFTLTVTDAHSCTSSSSVSISVNPAPIPVISLNGDSLHSTLAVSYQWLVDNTPIGGAVNSYCIPTQNGNYTVVVTDVNGCSGTSAILNYSSVGIQSINIDNGFSIYPNPANDYLIISVSEKISDAELTISDITGKVIHTAPLKTGNNNIDLSGFAVGYYLISVGDMFNRSVSKIFIME